LIPEVALPTSPLIYEYATAMPRFPGTPTGSYNGSMSSRSRHCASFPRGA